MSDTPRFPDVFAELLAGPVSGDTVRRVFDAIFAGAWLPTQIAAFVAGLRLRGESPEVIGAAALAMRSVMVPVAHGLPKVLDTCGTGGDGHGTLNVSTGAAVLVAAAGIPVAKHGNRAASSRTGSADVLEALGIPLDLPPAASAELLREVGIAFLLAPVHHPAMRHAAPVRKELGIRTLFNSLGPLCNPAGATHQLLGAAEEPMRTILAETLRALGSTHAWVVRGTDGLDEVSPCATTRVAVVTPTSVTQTEVAPEDFGLPRLGIDALRGGDAEENAAALEQVLSGRPHPATDAFVLNAAAALVVAEDLAPKGATDRIRSVLASGAAARTLSEWRKAAILRKSSAAVTPR